MTDVRSSVEPALAALARGVLGATYSPEVPSRMLEKIGEIGSAADRKQLLSTLRFLNSKLGAVALTGKAVPVSWLSPSAAEALVQRWTGSRLPVQRRLAAVVRNLALSAAYGFPGAEWDAMGYPGPLGSPPTEPKRLEPIEITEDAELACDVVIVGSGAGGGCAAGNLAAAGLDVIVLEKGRYHSESDFTHYESDATRDMYLYGMTLSTADVGVVIVAGSTLGGGTLVNYATAFRTPDHVRRQWAELSGIDAFVSDEYDESLDEVAERLGVNVDSSAAGKRDSLMEEGLKKLGWHVDQMPRAVRGCTQDEQCGYCGFGCRVGAKQSTMRTYLEDAASHGARIVTGADVRKVRIENGRSTGVEGTANGHRLNVTASAVVAAGGSIETPALLLRSGLRGEVGRNLHLHPGTAAFALFDEDVRAWEGTTQARYSNEFRHWDGGYGPIFETVPVHPGAGSAAVFPWLSAADHRSRMKEFAKASFCAVLPRDRSAGRVRIARDGTPRVVYRLRSDDAKRITQGLVAAGQVMEAAGAREIYTMHSQPITYKPGTRSSHDEWAEEIRSRGVRKGMTFFSYHQMGSCRMGTDPSASVVDDRNECHEVERLFVVDGSTFPDASGVNPMLSIYAIANRASKKIAARLA
jgi:choline dehydrogenase-like flavoprotein